MQKRSIKDFVYRFDFLFPFLKGHNGFIAGGVFKSIFLSQPINDVDIWFYSEKDFLLACSIFNSSSRYTLVSTTENALTYKDSISRLDVQFIKNFYISVEDCFFDMDFSVCKFALQGDFVYFDDFFFEDLQLRRLRLDQEFPLSNPSNIIPRIIKYVSLGFTIYPEDLSFALKVFRESPFKSVPLSSGG